MDFNPRMRMMEPLEKNHKRSPPDTGNVDVPAINPTPEQVKEFAAQVPDGQPLVMINLLRFREWADYPPGTRTEKHTGQEAYELYSQHALGYLAKVGGRPIWRGDTRYSLIAPSNERWDEAILVRYPSRGAFERMVADPGYQSGLYLRTAALADSRLIATIAPQHVGRLAWWIVRSWPFKRAVGLPRRG
jgi:uncharacterized protein (DUF1330 family)